MIIHLCVSIADVLHQESSHFCVLTGVVVRMREEHDEQIYGSRIF